MHSQNMFYINILKQNEWQSSNINTNRIIDWIVQMTHENQYLSKK